MALPNLLPRVKKSYATSGKWIKGMGLIAFK